MRLVYIDENGNEHPVSGRPTSAENLPIAPGSSTSTAEAVNEVNGAVGALDNRVPKIQYGTINAGLIPANAVKTVNITFSGFTSTPQIIVCLDMVTSQISATRDLTVVVNEDNVTTTSAEIDIINLSSAVYGGLNWIAIGS